MIANTIDLVAEALRHPDFGVNRVVDQIPREGDWPKPENVSILTALDDDDAAKGKNPPTFPALVVTIETPVEGEGEIEARNVRDYSVDVQIRYVTDEEMTSSVWLRMVQVLRGVLYSLDELTKESNPNVSANQNGIFIVSKNVVFAGAAGTDDAEDDPLLRGAVVVRFFVRDTFKLT